MSNAISSPCVSVCALDDDDICVGCYRTGSEISEWGGYNEDEKAKVMQQVRQRAKQDGGIVFS